MACIAIVNCCKVAMVCAGDDIIDDNVSLPVLPPSDKLVYIGMYVMQNVTHVFICCVCTHTQICTLAKHTQ